MVKVNELTLKLVNTIMENATILGAKINKLDSGQTVIDLTNGTWEAGRILGEICMGGLGKVAFNGINVDGHYLPTVNVSTSEPIISCMAS